jgi:hypothetical protein
MFSLCFAVRGSAVSLWSYIWMLSISATRARRILLAGAVHAWLRRLGGLSLFAEGAAVVLVFLVLVSGTIFVKTSGAQ